MKTPTTRQQDGGRDVLPQGASLPPQLELLTTPPGYTLRYTQRHPTWWVAALVLVALIGYHVYEAVTLPHPERYPLWTRLADAPFWLAQLGFLYVCVASFFNATSITILPGEVRIKHGPLPWPGNRTILAGNVLDVQSRETRDGEGGASYAVVLQKRDRKRRKIVGRLTQASQADYIAQTIRTVLKIPDRTPLRTVENG